MPKLMSVLITGIRRKLSIHQSARQQSLGLGRCLLWLICLLGVCRPIVAFAHGGGALQLADVAVGPYRLFVWSAPETARVGDVHFSIGLVGGTAATGALDEPVLDANVEVTLRSLAQPEQQFTQTSRNEETLLQYYYESDFVLPTAGRWQASIAVVGPAGSGDASFELEVLPARRTNWPLISGGILALLIGIGIYGRRFRSREDAN